MNALFKRSSTHVLGSAFRFGLLVFCWQHLCFGNCFRLLGLCGLSRQIYTHAYTHTYIPEYIYTNAYKHTHTLHAYTYMYISTHTHTYITIMHLCVTRTYLPLCMYLRTCIHTYVPSTHAETKAQTHTHTHLHTQTHTNHQYLRAILKRSYRAPAGTNISFNNSYHVIFALPTYMSNMPP